jgi:hypothetical protein
VLDFMLFRRLLSAGCRCVAVFRHSQRATEAGKFRNQRGKEFTNQEKDMTRTCRVRLLVVALLLSAAGLYAAAQEQQPQVKPELLDALEDARGRIADVQRQLIQSDVYHCCIKPACTFCEIAQGSCPCGDLLKQGQGVCTECFGGWYAGQGALERDKVTIEPNPDGGASRILYDNKPIRLMPISRLRTVYNGRSKALGGEPAEEEPAAEPQKPSGDQP